LDVMSRARLSFSIWGILPGGRSRSSRRAGRSSKSPTFISGDRPARASVSGSRWFDRPVAKIREHRACRSAALDRLTDGRVLAHGPASDRRIDPWKGTLTQFLELIAEWAAYSAVAPPGWPMMPSRAAIELRRIVPELRMFGLSVNFDRSSRAGRIVTFTSTGSSDKARVHVG
jgi:hypothetical protein